MKGKMYAIIGFLLLAATVAPSSVYFFNFAESAPQRVVQLHIVCYDDAISLNDHPLIAADALIDFETEYGRTVSRSKFNIASQIQIHAAGYLFGERNHSNPMDIEIN